jgi:hypothetical protein
MRSDLENLTNVAGAPEEAEARRAAARLVELVRADHVPLSPEAVARVRRGIDRRLRGAARASTAAGFSAIPVRRPLSAGVAALVLLSAMGAGAALWRHRRVEPAIQEAAPSAVTRPKVATRRGHRRVAAHSPEQQAPEVDEPEAPGAEAPIAPPSPPVTPPPVPGPSPAPAAEPAHRSRRQVAAPPPVETEARLLALALGQIRQQHDPAAALATLDRLERRFPGGVLADEVRATHIEAAVAAKDLRTATRLVEGAAIPAGRSGLAILVMRGELRAQAARCDEAVADFTQALAQGAMAADELSARALYGRAVCFQRMGQGARARVDLEALRRDHPRSRLGREAERLLADGPK